MKDNIAARHSREIDYHRERARLVKTLYSLPISYDMLANPGRRWWVSSWCVWKAIVDVGVHGRSVLVIGCGEGKDAIRLAALGAKVSAFDLSADMLAVARERAKNEGVDVEFREMAAEDMDYPDSTFDAVIAMDVMHHCDVAACLREIARVARSGAFVLVSEPYTHSALQFIRESVIGRGLRKLVFPVIYPHHDEYITPDERKINEREFAAIRSRLNQSRCDYFGLVVNRFLPPWEPAAKIDRLALKCAGPLGYLLAGRFVLTGYLSACPCVIP